MADKPARKVEISWAKVALIERYSAVLYPIDLPDLLSRLPTQGYVVPEKVFYGSLPQEEMATKGDVHLRFNPDNKTLGVQGRTIDGVLTAFVELQEFLKKEIDPNPDLSTHYVELTGQGTTKTGKDPLSVFSAYWSQTNLFEPLKELLGEETVNRGIELVPANCTPNSASWFHLRIQPLLTSPHRSYYVDIVWRNPSVDKMLGVAKHLEETISKLIKEIEGK